MLVPPIPLSRSPLNLFSEGGVDPDIHHDQIAVQRDTNLHGEERGTEHAHGVHVLRERTDHILDVLRDAGAFVKVRGQLVHLRYNIGS